MTAPSHEHHDRLRYACRVLTTHQDEKVLLGKLINNLTLTELETFCELAARIDPACLMPAEYNSRRK